MLSERISRRKEKTNENRTNQPTCFGRNPQHQFLAPGAQVSAPRPDPTPRLSVSLLKLAIGAIGLERWRQVHGIDSHDRRWLVGVLFRRVPIRRVSIGVDLVRLCDFLQGRVRLVKDSGSGGSRPVMPTRMRSSKTGEASSNRSRGRRRAPFARSTLPMGQMHPLYFVNFFLNFSPRRFCSQMPGFEVAQGNPYLSKITGRSWPSCMRSIQRPSPLDSHRDTIPYLLPIKEVVDAAATRLLWLRWCQAGSSHFCLEYETIDGIVFPTHRRALGRDPQQEEPDRSAPPGVEVTITDIHILNQRNISALGGS